MAQTEPLLRVDDLAVHFPIRRGAVLPRQVGMLRAVDGVSFAVVRGRTLGLVGESGCGKSTLGRALLGIHAPTRGRILFDGEDIGALRGKARRAVTRRLQMIFQDSSSAVNPRQSVAEIIAEPLQIHGFGRRAVRSRVAELLALVCLPDRYGELYPHQLSGGQRQRVGIARAVALEPDFIVCDEAVSALDVSIQAQVVNLLKELQQRLGLAYLFIGHDLAVVRQMSDRIAVMYVGQVVESGNSEALVDEPLHPYTRLLMAAVPLPDPVADRARRAARAVVVGEPPSPAAPPAGCRFCTRCPEAAGVRAKLKIDCATVAPAIATVAPGREVACHLYAPCRPDAG